MEDSMEAVVFSDVKPPIYVPFPLNDPEFEKVCDKISSACGISKFLAKAKFKAIIERLAISKGQFLLLDEDGVDELETNTDSDFEELEEIFKALSKKYRRYLQVITYTDDETGEVFRILFSDWLIGAMGKYVESFKKSLKRRENGEKKKFEIKFVRTKDIIVRTSSDTVRYKLTKLNTELNGTELKASYTEPELEATNPDPTTQGQTASEDGSGSLVSREDVHGDSQVSAESVVERPENVGEGGVPVRITCKDGYADVGRFIDEWQARFKYIDVRKEIGNGDRGIEKWLRGQYASGKNHVSKADAYSSLTKMLEEHNAKAKAEKPASTGYDNSNLYIPKNLQGQQ